MELCWCSNVIVLTTLLTAVAAQQSNATVKNVVLEVLAADSVKVSWDEPELSQITKYHVFYRPRDESKKLQESKVEVSGDSTSVLINKTFKAGLYIFEVTAQHIVNGEELMSQRSDMSIMLMVDDTPPKSETDVATTVIAGVVVGTCFGFIALTTLAIFLLWGYRTGRVSRYIRALTLHFQPETDTNHLARNK